MNHIKKHVIYSQIRNFWDWKDLKIVFLNEGFKYTKHLNILVKLSRDKEELWADVNSKRRNEIRKARKEGTQFLIRETKSDLSVCYTILNTVYKRVKLPFPEVTLFESVLNFTNDRMGLKIFCAVNDNKIIGCMLALVYKETIYDFYAGALKEFYSKYPNDLIPWEVFMWGKDNQYKYFDFGGAGKTQYSLWS